MPHQNDDISESRQIAAIEIVFAAIEKAAEAAITTPAHNQASSDFDAGKLLLETKVRSSGTLHRKKISTRRLQKEGPQKQKGKSRTIRKI